MKRKIFQTLTIIAGLSFLSACTGKEKIDEIINPHAEVEQIVPVYSEKDPKAEAKNEDIAFLVENSEEWLEKENAERCYIAVTDLNEDEIPELIVSYLYDDKYLADSFERSYIVSIDDNKKIVKEETNIPIHPITLPGGKETRKIYYDSEDTYLVSEIDYMSYRWEAVNISDCSKESIPIKLDYRNWRDEEGQFEYILLYDQKFDRISVSEFKENITNQFAGFSEKGIDLCWINGSDDLGKTLQESWGAFEFTDASLCEDAYFQTKFGDYKYADYSLVSADTASLFKPLCFYDENNIQEFNYDFVSSYGDIVRSDDNRVFELLDINEFKYIAEYVYGLKSEELLDKVDKEEIREYGVALDEENYRLYAYNDAGGTDLAIFVSDRKEGDETVLEYILCNDVEGTAYAHREVRIKENDNLFGYSVAGVSNADNKSLIEKVLNKAGASESDILDSVVFDLDGDGSEEAFVFIAKSQVDDLNSCEGTLWFVSDEKCETVRDNENFVYLDGKALDTYFVSGRVYVSIRISYFSSAVSRLYYVDNGEVKEARISGVGSFFKSDYVEDYCVSISAYDRYLNYEEGKENEGMFTGHTWKIYYFYFDNATGEFMEYTGSEITREELTDAVGFDLAKEIEDEGYQVDKILKRDNGIINVDYSKTVKNEDGSLDTEYRNVTYNEKTGMFYDAWGTGEYTWQGSDMGGTY